jgi:asparagine synthetase B (glutamine-hydrolysing)
VSALQLIGRLDHNFPFTGAGLVDLDAGDVDTPLPESLRGAFCCVAGVQPNRYRVARDPLGINKLFWARREDGQLLMAARPQRLVVAGCGFDSIRAIPPGTVTDLDFARGTSQVSVLPPGRTAASSARPLEALAPAIRATLDAYLSALASKHLDAHVLVCLSGGLDSAGVALMAREHFRRVTAASFDLRAASGPPSADRQTAVRLARDLDIPLLEVTVTGDELLELLDCVLVEAIDWREFNVHAALVNAGLARGITAALSATETATALVLTGDLMNEFLVDYHPETYRGRVYYNLPRLPAPALRDALVRGLETSHREVGPFEAWGLPVVQPYSAALDHYLDLPAELLSAPDRKERISRLVFGNAIPEYVYRRPKVRAQIGGGGGEAGHGVLGLCADKGLDDQWLRQRFAALHGVAEVAMLDRFIRAGRYRAGTPPVEEQCR